MEAKTEPNERGINAFLNKVAACLIINACFLAACLPVVTVGPALSAMYEAVRKNVLHDRGYASREFFKAFRGNLIQGTFIWVLFMLAQAVMAFDISYLFGQAREGHAYGLLYLAVGVFLVLSILTALYCAAYQARFRNSSWRTVRSSFLIMLMHPFRNLLILFLLFVMVMLISVQIWMILFLPVFFMMAFCQYMEKNFYRLMNEEERRREDERNRDYAAEEIEEVK